jgi:hypothetical protein
MTRWSRSEVSWRPAKRRSRIPFLLLSVVAAAAALVGYGRLDVPIGLAIGTGQRDAVAVQLPVREPAGHEPLKVQVSGEPQPSPSPRTAERPRPSPMPREVREAAIGATR